MEDWLTLAKAEEQGYGKASTIKTAIRRGKLEGTLEGKTWFVHRDKLAKWKADKEAHKRGLRKGQKINRQPRAEDDEN